MVSVTLVKLILVIYCRTFTNEIVKAYAQDHFFDVITNSIGLFAAVLASTWKWWIDPAGAIVVSSSLTITLHCNIWYLIIFFKGSTEVSLAFLFAVSICLTHTWFIRSMYYACYLCKYILNVNIRLVDNFLLHFSSHSFIFTLWKWRHNLNSETCHQIHCFDDFINK